MLPNRFATPVYYVLQIAVNASSGVFLHSRHYMRIEVHGDPNLRVPKAFASDLGVYAGGQHMGCVSVAQIVETNARQRLVLREQQVPLVREASRLQGATIGLSNDKSFVR